MMERKGRLLTKSMAVSIATVVAVLMFIFIMIQMVVQHSTFD